MDGGQGTKTCELKTYIDLLSVQAHVSVTNSVGVNPLAEHDNCH